MDDVTFRWSTLLKKYMDNTITPDELIELERQRLSSTVKERQFQDITDPKQFINRVQARNSASKQKAWKIITDRSTDEKNSKIIYLKITLGWILAPLMNLKKSLKWIISSGAFLSGCVVVIYLLSSHREPEVKSYTYVNLEGDEYKIEDVLKNKFLSDKFLYDDSAIVILGNAYLSNFNESRKTFIVTSKGNQLRIILSDGTKVILNAASSIIFPLQFTGKNRKVTVYGQALFDVKPDEKPFIVVVNNIEVKALGTTFNVKNYKNEDVRASLLQGKIELVVGKKSYKLNEGQEAVFDNDDNLNITPSIDKEQAIAWTKNEFDFRNATIHEIINELSRWYNVDVEFKGYITNKRYYVRFSRSQKLNEILNVINAQNIVNTKIVGNRVVVLGDKNK